MFREAHSSKMGMNADGDTRVFCAKSAEVIDKKGDGVFSLAKERAKRAPLADRGRKERAKTALQEAGGQAKERGAGEIGRGWLVRAMGKGSVDLGYCPV